MKLHRLGDIGFCRFKFIYQIFVRKFNNFFKFELYEIIFVLDNISYVNVYTCLNFVYSIHAVFLGEEFLDLGATRIGERSSSVEHTSCVSDESEGNENSVIRDGVANHNCSADNSDSTSIDDFSAHHSNTGNESNDE